jgi:hypothetical protein
VTCCYFGSVGGVESRGNHFLQVKLVVTGCVLPIAPELSKV